MIRIFGGCKSFEHFARNRKKHQNESVVTSQMAKSMLNVTVWPLRIIRLNVKCGVPQGSIMGPLLFNINDIHLSSSLLKFILFAQSKSVDNHIESDYLSETRSWQPRLYRIIVLQENDTLATADSEQLLRENNPL